jgi:hypothetical protein
LLAHTPPLIIEKTDPPESKNRPQQLRMYGNNEFPGDAGAAVLTEDDVVEEHVVAQGDSLDPQVAAARIIRIGGIQPASIKARDWPAEFVRPKLEHLKAEITRRDSSKKPGGYTADKCLAYLKTTEFPGELARDEQPTFDKCMQIAKKPAEAAEAEGEEQDEAVDGSAGLRWSAKKHVTKLVHAIVEHKESFLDRHKKKTRAELDAHAVNDTWQRVAQTFNDPDFKKALRLRRRRHAPRRRLRARACAVPSPPAARRRPPPRSGRSRRPPRRSGRRT